MSRIKPLRPELVSALGDETRAEVMLGMGTLKKSPSSLARELDVPLKLVTYAVKVLTAGGLLKEVGREPVPGSSTYATFYVATARFDDDLRRIAKRVAEGAKG